MQMKHILQNETLMKKLMTLHTHNHTVPASHLVVTKVFVSKNVAFLEMSRNGAHFLGLVSKN